MGYVESPLCSLCQDSVETTAHVLYHCQYAKNIWSQLKVWIAQYIEGTVDFNEENVLFGFKGRNNNPLNAITLLTKIMLYKYNLKEVKPKFDLLQKDILLYYQVTKFNAYSSGEFAKFHTFWSSLHVLFSETTSL